MIMTSQLNSAVCYNS